MANKILIKTSVDDGNVPSTSDCTVSELGVNVCDGKLFLGTDLDNIGHLIPGQNSQEVSWIGAVIKDEDDMSSDSRDSLATQQSIKAYQDNMIFSREGSDATYTSPTYAAHVEMVIPADGVHKIEAYFEWHFSHYRNQWSCRLMTDDNVDYGHALGNYYLASGGDHNSASNYGWGYYAGYNGDCYVPESLVWIGPLNAGDTVYLDFAEWSSYILTVRNARIIGTRVKDL